MGQAEILYSGQAAWEKLTKVDGPAVTVTGTWEPHPSEGWSEGHCMSMTTVVAAESEATREPTRGQGSLYGRKRERTGWDWSCAMTMEARRNKATAMLTSFRGAMTPVVFVGTS